MAENKVVIIIPVHKEILTDTEIVSLKQCRKVFSKRKVILIGPSSIQYSSYLLHYPELEILKLSDNNFKSIDDYNKMKLSLWFYDFFADYDYLLTYELDSYVFRDEIDYWCDLKYDFIGAPWFEGYSSPTSTTFLGVGNSGFSLRNIKKIKYTIKNYNGINNYNSIFDIPLLLIKYILNWFSTENQFIQLSHGFSEDYLIHSASKNLGLNIPSPEIALKFSFEVFPEFLYEKNNRNLPFGCHAWSKYNFEFWRKFIILD